MTRALLGGAATLLLSLVAACGGSDAPPAAADPPVDPNAPRTRYALNNQCFALKANATGKYVASAGGGYAASAADAAGAEPFYLKPAALGRYLLYDHNRELLTAGAPVASTPVPDATEADAVWDVRGTQDATAYPPPPPFDREPAPADLDAYRTFVDPNLATATFRLAAGGAVLVADGETLTTAAASGAARESFSFEALAASACRAFPEGLSSATGVPFAGTTADGRVLGMADVHVHIVSTTFLGNALWGRPFHPLGIQHALGDCSGPDAHGSDGGRDFVGGFLGPNAPDPRHDTTGWPTFNEHWPSRDNLTHQAIYWKWLERAWLAGLRIAVNDLVENATLCELQRNNSGDQTADCNEMNSAGRQVGTLYGMQDYIDAQHGGRGAGWFRIVLDPDAARAAVAAGKLAVVMGIEVSNFLNCQITYNPNPARREPFEEPSAETPGENTYACTEASLRAELDRIHAWGVRQVISIHEFDSAFGGNGIFFPIINLGNRENSGGIPASGSSGPFTPDDETPTGEFWTTYDCPVENVTPGFTGYLWDDEGGSDGADLRTFVEDTPTCNPGNPDQCLPCTPTGQGGRYGGSTPCYPNGVQQCNARWMTPIGKTLYKELMERGFIFDFDHMELYMKTQALDLAEAQPIAYPFVSTHGTFGGTSNGQALRVLKNGGFLYPSLGSSESLLDELEATRALHEQIPPAQRPLFGFGFGTDTNGLSSQAGTEPGVTYPFTLFDGGVFDQLPEFAAIAPVQFEQPASADADGVIVRRWHINEPTNPDEPGTAGSAHFGMLAEMVAGMSVRGTAQDLRDLFNSAERFLRTWEQTLDAQAAIEANGGAAEPAHEILIAAPRPGEAYPPEQ